MTELLNKYGDMKIIIPLKFAKTGSRGIEIKECPAEMTVREALNCWDNASWIAENEKVKISFDEDRGHKIFLK